jgi:hypothetical protein
MKRTGTGRLVVGVCVVVMSCLVTPAAPQSPPATVEPQAIISEWQGAWTSPRDPTSQGSYYMTIKKIEGTKK